MMHCDILFWFCSTAFFRYFRLIVNLIAYWTFRPIPISDEPKYSSKDVTVIIPTIDGDGDELRATIRSILKAEPAEIIVVTIDANFKTAVLMAAAISRNIRVLSVSQANKRRQMCQGIPEVRTEITVFADDDVSWPEQTLLYMLAPFEDPQMGGVGTSQHLRREKRPNLWNFLGAAYLIRRNFDIAACTHLDGGIPCLSGRTVAYRTNILQDPEFQYHFTHETWRTYQLNADDDNFLTRWMVSHGWKTWVQFHKDCEIETTLEDNPKYLKQCLRWARSNWRSNLKSMFLERDVWRRHPWSCYAVFQTTITDWALIIDPLLIWMLWRVTADWSSDTRWAARAAFLVWMWFLSRVVKYLQHFARYPQDLIYIPVITLFGYYHSIIKFKALCTLHETAWGTREGADADDSSRMVPLPRRKSSCQHHHEKFSILHLVSVQEVQNS